MKTFRTLFTVLAWLSPLCAHPAFAGGCVTSTCHPDIAAFKKLHSPVKDGDCTSCHVQRVKEHPLKGGKSFELAAKGASLCSSCHDGMVKKKFVHVPVKEGECLSCHNPHGAAERYLMDVGDDKTALCLNCHDEAPFKEKWMHGPAAVGSCTECHDPHDAAEKKLLKGSVRDLCLKCHADFSHTLKGAPVTHPPVKEGPCTACHNPHGTPVSMFLNDKMPDLCVGCHKGIGKKAEEAKVPHKPLKKEGGCSNCHSSHYSNAKGLLAQDEKSTCLNCHGTDTLGKPPLRNIKKEIAGKKYVHGPIQKGQCKACHDPHGSDNFRMLIGGYPEPLYVPYKAGSYDVCLKCHEKNMLSYPDTTIYTKFRNGNRNLHYVHVSNVRKGRTCRVCHAAHASNGERLLHVEGMTFGEWKIPINFKITPNGGSCAPGCHRAFVYDRVTPQDYRK
ncbi:cytochrome c3 family protein [Geomonas sp. RF6]|uniref:cytochrome c3 family protein n=1 Tax=Geomonas sp. RF6 TaxID=2897342 RepID=UPI001E31A97B|nr:cytochrome c3 family protein [Geomonas sp. RF6]UFS71066.1 cytochrome c3 family protein [Geomonas sp. RF6]